MSFRNKSSVGLLQIKHLEEHYVRVYSNRISIWRKDGERLSWEEVQKIKCEVIGDTIAIEVYPADIEVVNLRHTRHLWFGEEITKTVFLECHHEEFNNELDEKQIIEKAEQLSIKDEEVVQKYKKGKNETP